MPEVFTQNDYINAGRLQHKISHLRKLIESQRMSNERLCYRLEALNMVESIIDAQPKTDVKRVRHGRWIPCSERMPESHIYVLCAGRDGIGILRYIGSKWLDGESHVYTTNEITHWMPLPEPPESEEGGERE